MNFENMEITFNIEKLSSEELAQLSKILYRYGYMQECETVNRRKVFIES